MIALAFAPLLAVFTAAPSLDAAIAAEVRSRDFSGTILVHDGKRLRYHRSFGRAERALGVPAKNDTRYRVASITKLFTSLLIQQLHEEGKLDVAKPVASYLPDFRGEGADRITLHQLLNHTSGIEQYDRIASLQDALENGVPHYQRPMTTQAMLERCCSGKLASEPGARFDYNNADYVVLGAIIERLTGARFADLLAQLGDRKATIILLANTNRADLDGFAQRIADVLVQ